LSRVIKAHDVTEHAVSPLASRETRRNEKRATPGSRARPVLAADITERAAFLAQVRRESRRLLRQAEKAVERRMAELAEAEAALEREREQARALGHQQGYEAGYREGFKKGHAEGVAALGALLADARSMLEEARLAKDRLLEQAEEEIVQLAVAIAEKLVRQSLAHDDKAVLSILKEMLKKAEGSATARVKVPPDVFERIQEEWRFLAAYVQGDCRLEFLPDESLSRGDVIVETDWGMIDGRVQSRWQRIMHGLDLVGQSDDDGH
jgi:Flagellar biosynthesis/type III secretory pathway protein